MPNWRKFVLLLLLLTSCAFASPPGDLSATIDGMIAVARKDHTFKAAKIGIAIRSLDDGANWYAKAANWNFIPASNTKLVTAALAMEFLPGDFRFTTRMLARGEVRDHVLQGDLILQGGGDPTLTPDDLRSLAHALATGDPDRMIPPIHAVSGRVSLDGSVFPCHGPQLGQRWEQDDLPWYYAAPASALSCNRNALQVVVRGTDIGKPAIVSLIPESSLFSVVNLTVTSGEVTAGSAQILPKGKQIFVSGKLAPGAEFSEKIAARDPERFLLEQTMSALAAEGITVNGNRSTAEAPVSVLYEHQSVPLPEVIAGMLKVSDNHTAEQLRWTMLAELKLHLPPSQRYAAILQDIAERTGIPERSLHLVDGSGLSRDNRVTPAAVLDLLGYEYRSPRFCDLYEALPIAGIDGTLRKRLTGTPAGNNARAKTGTMRGVCALSGYVTTRSGDHLAFVIFVNGYRSGSASARGLQDRIVAYLAGV